MVFFFVFSVIGVCLALSRGGAAPAFLPVASNDAAAGGSGVAVHAVSRSCWLGFLHFALQKYTFCGEYRQKKG